jgi:G3E family GTPase
MIKIDLITGFLGTGKTTFIKKYVQYLMNQGKKIGIIENDYGAINIDRMLLQELEGENCEIEMVTGGSDLQTHQRRFKTKLVNMAMLGYDHIIVEPSGIYDVDEFFDTMHEEPLDQWYEIGSVITIVDANINQQLSKQSRYLLTSQLSEAGCIILSKTKNASQEDIEKTIQYINTTIKEFKCQRSFNDEIIIKDWNDFNDDDYKMIQNSGYKYTSYMKMHVLNNNQYSTLFYMNLNMNKDKLDMSISKLMNDEQYGKIIRIKGFILENNQWYEYNITPQITDIKEIDNGQNVIIVIGENLNEDKINQVLK